MKPWMLKCALPVVAAVAWSSAGWAQITIVPDTSRLLTAGGRATVVATPDMASVSLGVYVLDPDLRKAKGASDRIVRGLLQVADDLGLPPADVSSSALDIEPQYSDDKQPVFRAYEVSRTVEVTLRDLAKLDALIDRAIQAGANRQFAVTLQSSRERELREQAMSMAMENAKAQAARLAAGFGVKLGPVRSIRPGLDSGNGASMGATISYGHGTFAPGTIRFEEGVSVTFLLVPSAP